MERSRKHEQAVIAELQQGGDRSGLFWWLVDHHDEIVHATRGQRIRWDGFAKSIAKLGLLDFFGNSPNPRVCRLTWYKARVFVAAARASTRAPAVEPSSPLGSMPRSLSVRPPIADQQMNPPTDSRQWERNVGLGPTASCPEDGRVWEETTSNAVGDAALLGEPVPVQSGIAASFPPATCASLPLSASHNIAVIPPVAPPSGVATQKPKWTPEQQARIDASKARTMSQLEHSDRFINLKE